MLMLLTMFICRTGALGWARNESRWKAIRDALKHSSLKDVTTEVTVEVWESDVDEVYVNQMGAVRIDAEDVPEDAPEDYEPLEKVREFTLSAREADKLADLLSAVGELKMDLDHVVRCAIREDEEPETTLKLIRREQDAVTDIAEELFSALESA